MKLSVKYQGLLKCNVLLVACLFLHPSPAVVAGRQPPDNEWITYRAVNGVSILYKYSDCNLPEEGVNRQYILLKVVNNSSLTKKLEFGYEVFYDDKCRTCDKKESQVALVIPPGGSQEGACSLSDSTRLRIFVKHLNLPNRSAFSRFQLGKIKVTQL